MKVILLKDLKPHGKAGDLIDISDGYAKNCLIPQKIAVEAKKSMINEFQQKKEKEARLAREEKERAMQLKKDLEGKTFPVKAKCGADDKMYGSVTAQNVADALKLQGYEVEKKHVQLKDPIRQLGVYPVDVWVYKETVAKISIQVIKE